MFDSLVRSAATAPDPSEVDDAELVELIGAWERLACWAAAGQLAAIAELARRRPRDLADRPPGPTGPLSAGGPAAAGDAGHPGVPEVSEFAVDEVAAALRLSRPAAGVRLHTAVELTRLPATAAALRAGTLDLPKVRAVVDAVSVLDDLDRRRRRGPGAAAGRAADRRSAAGVAVPRGAGRRPAGRRASGTSGRSRSGR